MVPKQMSTGDRTILGRISSRMRCTDRKLTPTAFANRRPVQCSLLAAASARSITRCTVTAGNGGCLVGSGRLALPVRRVISVVPQPSAGRRHDDFGAPNMLLRRVAIADNRVKLTAIGVTFTTIPALMTRA
jgi:hypothetical protein